MSTSSAAAKAELVKMLGDNEQLLETLSPKVNAMELSKKMFQRCIISDSMRNQFTSLDHSRVDPQLQVRYLLRLVSEKMKEDESVWEKVLSLLTSMGERQLCEYVRVSSTTEVTRITIKNVCSDIPLTIEDIHWILEVLVKVSHKWEMLGTALPLPIHEIESCRKTDNKVNLKNILSCWLSGGPSIRSVSTLNNLKQALSSEMVGEGRVAQDLEERAREARGLIHTASTTDSDTVNPLLTISYQSDDIIVDDGKSTLLLVQASPKESVSYQWKKDGQPLANSCIYSGVHDDILVVSHASQGTEGEYTCCVSNQEREVCSNKITLTVLYPPAKEQLLHLYSIHREVPPDSWPPVGTKTFINLVLTRSDTEHSDLRNYFIRGNADKVTAQKEKIEYEQIFSEYKTGELILVDGRPGSGKTTLVNKIIKDWTKGKVLHKAKLVFLITLRNFNHDTEQETLSGILRPLYNNDEILRTVSIDVERANGEGVCFIMDGLDEYQPQDKHMSVIYKLLDKTYLPLAMIIVSSRPAATQKLRPEALTLRIEVFGFTKENILEYVDKFPFNTGSSESNATVIDPARLMEYLHSHPNVFDMCYLPVHAAMICFLFKHEKGNIPCTQTKIYEEFTRSMILRHLKRHNNDIRVHSLKELRGNIKEHFNNLCHLAFNMTVNSKQVVTLDEMGIPLTRDACGDDEWSLGLVTINHTAQLSGVYKTYTFLHLTLQEFLTAYYMTNLKTEEQFDLIEKYITSLRRWSESCMSYTVWTFYCGLVKFQFQSELTKFYEILYKEYDMIPLLRCVFESQQQVVCDEVVKQLLGRIRLYSTLTPSDGSVLGYVLSTSSQPVTELKVPHCDDITQLLQQISCNNFRKLESLTISAPMNDAGLQALSGILKSCASLQYASLEFQQLSPDGAKYVADGFKHLTIKKLDIYCSLSSSGGVMTIFSGLQYLISTRLILRFECLDISGASEVASGLQLLTNIPDITLDLFNTNAGHNGTAALANGIHGLTNLRTLKLSNNNIGPDGATALANAMHGLANLRTLILSNNNIGPDGATALANAMHGLANLKYLILSNNNIGPDGATALANAMHGLTNLRTLILSNNNIGPDGATALANAMHGLSILQTLNLSKNNIGPDGATALANAMHGLSILQTLNLSKNNIGPDGAKALAYVFHSISNLTALDLSDNYIGPTGAISLAHGLVHLTELRSLNLSGNWIDLSNSPSVIRATKNCKNAVHFTFSDNQIGYGFIDNDAVDLFTRNGAAVVLVAATQHDRELHLGFKSLNVPSKKSVVPQEETVVPQEETVPSKTTFHPTRRNETNCTLL